MIRLFRIDRCRAAALGWGLGLASLAALGGPPADARGKSIPFDQLGAEAQKQYTGDGIRIIPGKDGATLKAIMQDLEGEATPEGLWITSTADEDIGKPNRFRVWAVEVGRMKAGKASGLPATLQVQPSSLHHLPETGLVRASKDAVLWLRPGLIEHYTVSTDGVRQDFIIPRRPLGTGGCLAVDLAISGARAMAAGYGARLAIEATGRELAYSRLRVTDSAGRELPAEMQVIAPGRLRLVVQDAAAVYPVRIDPTFSDADWISVNPGMPGVYGSVTAVASDGSGNLYIGGAFSFAGSVVAKNIAKWNGNTWSALGLGIDGIVNALAVSGADLYVGGRFAAAGEVAANGIAKWNGSSWTALGSGMGSTVPATSAEVYALIIGGADLYAGGSFTTAGGLNANNIAKWNGTEWFALGSGMGPVASSTIIYALAWSGNDLYAGGAFASAGGLSADNIAKWDGGSWQALGSGTNSTVATLAASGSDVFAGGGFSTAGGISASRIAKWNGGAWSALGTGVTGGFSASVQSLLINGGDLIVGGRFTAAGGVAANNIAKWNGGVWSALGSGMTNEGTTSLTVGASVKALAMCGGDLFAGGIFARAGGEKVNHIAKWSGGEWSKLGAGLDGAVHAIAFNGCELYAGGFFAEAGGVIANNVVKWDGDNWQALGSGMNRVVRTLAFLGADLIAGGDFSTAGGSSANCIAKWNGSTWSGLGSGMAGGAITLNSPGTGVYALIAIDGDLFAAGNFATAGGVEVNHIAKWDGTSWSAMGFGFDAMLFTLATNGNDLYAGGELNTAGGVNVHGISKWDGFAWSTLAPIDSGPVITYGSFSALVASGNDLYVGYINPSTNNYSILKWNGSTWVNIGWQGGKVNSLTINGGLLYAGGEFVTSNGVGANRISRWDGSTWSALGSGLNNTVYALAINGDDLYAGGSFTTAGGKVSPFLARANLAGGVPDSDGDGLLDSWEISHFAFRDAHGPLDDRDHDAYNELMELAFGLDPAVSSPGNQPPVVEEGGYLTMTITKQPGVSYEIQSAGTVLPGQPDSFSTASTTVLINDASTLKARDNVPVSAPGQRFMRVRVTAAP